MTEAMTQRTQRIMGLKSGWVDRILCSGILCLGIIAGRPAGAEEFDSLMRQGYAAIANREFATALLHFTQAESLKPEDPFVAVAIESLQASLNQAQSSPLVLLDLGIPGNRIPAAVRSEACGTGVDGLDLLPLMPDGILGVTVQAQPTLLFYIPSQVTATELDLAVRGEIFTYPLTQSAGIVALQLPVELAPGERVSWGVELLCSRDPAQNPAVRGELLRVNQPELMAVISQTPGSERLELYRSVGAWYDIAAELAQQLRAQPLGQNSSDATLQAQWQRLLESQELGSLQSAELLNCCTAL